MKSKGLMKRDGKRYMTLIEIAKATGASYRTVAAYAQKAGWTEHGKQALLDESQVTIITEAMKHTHKSNWHNGQPPALEVSVLDDPDKNIGHRKMSIREIAEITGVSVRTIQAYAQKAGWTVPREETLLNQKQTTLIVEAMKARGGQGLAESAQENLRSIETEQSAAVRVGMLMESIKRQYDEAMKIVAAENAKLKKEKEYLAVRLGEAEEWWSVKRVLAETGREYPWRPLVDYTKTHGPAPRKTFDANYGEVNSYHRDTWHDVYGVEL